LQCFQTLIFKDSLPQKFFPRSAQSDNKTNPSKFLFKKFYSGQYDADLCLLGRKDGRILHAVFARPFCARKTVCQISFGLAAGGNINAIH
jgi:hypothetical protein